MIPTRLHRLTALAALCFMAEPGAAGGAAASPTAPDTNVAGAEKKPRAPKNPDNILDIINGRLPLPLVFMIRFKKLGELSNGDAAKAYGTSVGKVFDINKGRNFGYVDASYKPSAEEVSAAKAWCETGKTAKGKTLSEAGGKPTEILAELAKMGVATAEEVAARNWQVRTVGAPAVAGTAPTATAPAPAGAAAPAEAKQGAKLF